MYISCVTLFLASVWVGVLTICALMLLGTVGNPDGSTAPALFLKHRHLMRVKHRQSQ